MTNNSNTNLVENFKSLFEKKDYNAAKKLLTQNKESFDQGVYFYNQGIISFAKEEYVSARVSFEKAKTLGYQTVNSESVLVETKERLSVTYLEQTDNQLEMVQKKLSDTGIEVFLTITLVFAILALIKRFSVATRTIFLVLCVSPLMIFFFFTKGHERVVSLEDKSVFRGPSKMFDEVQELPGGMIFIIKDSFEGWRRVVYPHSHQGWIKDEKMERL